MRLHHGDGADTISGAFAGVMAVTQRPIVSSRNPLRTEPMNPIGTITLDTA